MKITIYIGLLFFFFGTSVCLETNETEHAHGSSQQSTNIASFGQQSSQSQSTRNTSQASPISINMDISSTATGSVPLSTTPTDLQSSTSAILSSTLGSSLLPSASSLTSPLITPTVEQLLKIFNNTDTPPDHFLKGITHHWRRPLKKCYRKRRHGVALSMYWIPKEGQWDESEDGKRILLNNDGEDQLTPLLDPLDNVVANVSRSLWRKCRMEGTCLLQNGNLINLAQGYTNRFVVIGKEHRQQNIFGWGAGLQNLRPYISVAANDLPLGTTLYVRELDGLEIGNGQTHNGCVSVDDDGWSFGGCQLDLFVVSYVDHLYVDRELGLDRVSVVPRKCKLLNFSTMDHLKYMHADAHLETLSLVMNGTLVLPNDTLSTLIA